MEFIIQEGELIVYLEGKIDSANADSIKEELIQILKCQHSSLTLDFSMVKYISSSGLRILLYLANHEQDFKCIELSNKVYRVMEITGFTEIIPIQKAFKKISIEGKEVIGEGNHGTVYRLDEERVVKVYKNPDSIEEIKKEKNLARQAFVLGLPTAISYEIVRIENLYGAIFELLDSNSMIKEIQNGALSINDCVLMSVNIMKKMHHTEVDCDIIPPALDPYIQIMKDCKSLVPENVYLKCLELLKQLNDYSYLIHGDFHFKNILMQNEEPMLIDMDTLSKGHPIFEFVPIYIAYVGHGEVNPNVVEEFLGLSYEQTQSIWKQIIDLYFGNEKNVDKIRLLAYFRLLKRAHKKKQEEESYYKQKILELYEAVDTFEFD